jgi:branched-subunit amino acid aminotransferase/4-amino-4-deoxychorismate lyase
MSGPIALLNDRLVPAHEAVVPVYDAGFLQGTTVAEQLRTFGGRLFRLEQHLTRLANSLSIVGVDPGVSRARLAGYANEVAERNHALLDPDDDLALVIFVTPGPWASMAPESSERRPTLGIHTYPLPFRLWAEKYAIGERVATTGVAQVPRECWPPQLKCRSRMHYYLADREAVQRFAGARALLNDELGHLTEATTANLLLHSRDAALATPPAEKVLPGISLSVAIELAEQVGLAVEHRDIPPEALAQAEEAMLSSTTVCLLPIVEFNGRPVGGGRPGPLFERLLSAWSNLAGIDIAEQARRFATRR